MKIFNRVVARVIRELEGNNWLKVLFDKGFRYFFTIAVLWYVTGQLQIVNDSLLIVAFTMPVIDIIVFDVIDKYRKPKPIPEEVMKMLEKLGYEDERKAIEEHEKDYKALVEERQSVGVEGRICTCPMCNDGMGCCQINLPHMCNFNGAPWNK